MVNHSFKFLLLVFCGNVLAGGLPQNTEITSENAEALSIKLEKIDSGSTDTALYQLEFAGQLEKCSAGRVQTALISGESEISASSMDYQVGSNEPSVLLSMPAIGYDMAVTLQYCCAPGLYPGCQKSLSISSVKNLAAQ